MDLQKEAEHKADQAFANHILLSELCKKAEIYEFEKGRVLYEINKEKQFQVLGYATFDSYIAQPEINMGRSTAYLYKELWKKYVIDLEVDPFTLVGVGVTKLRKLKKYCIRENVIELLNDASQLSRSDLDTMLAERFGVEKPKKSNQLYFIKVEVFMYGCDWYFLVRAADIQEARQKAHTKYMEEYLADPELIAAGQIDPEFSDIELDKQGVSKPIVINAV